MAGHDWLSCAVTHGSIPFPRRRAVAQQGPPSSRSGRVPAADPPGRGRPGDGYPGDDEEYPPWAVPRRAGQDERERRPDDPRPPGGQDAAGDGGSRRRRPSRSARAAARRTRRKYIWGGAVAAVLVIAAGVGYQLLHRSAPRPAAGSLVTTFLPGELRSVPDACSAVTPATLQAYLPGPRRTVAPKSLDGSAQSLCDWTLDARPLYRVLEVTLQAYSPSGLASGNGSATAAAKDAYAQARQQLTHPVKASHLPPAALTPVPGLGGGAFAAVQLPRAGPTNLVTVVLRSRNVLITVVSEGPANRRGGYSPASPAQLQAAAAAAARDILAHLP
jgi:hypothetical protein